MVRYLEAGESHGKGLVAIVEGLPAGIPVDVAFINRQLARRQGGYGRGGRMKIEKDQVEITNSSYVTIAHNQKYLYSITDFGVEAYRIVKGGDLEFINKASINGMRGSYLSTDYTDSWLFVAGYHDGKITVLKLDSDS